MLAVVLPAVATRLVGAEGVVMGVNETDANAPLPAAFTARSRRVYTTPLVRPVSVNGLVVDPVPLQLEPPLVEY